MGHYDYLIWFLEFALIPVVVVWFVWWRILAKYPKVFLYCILGSIIFGYPWDYWATHSWLWHFSAAHIVGVSFFGLPLEEYVFFISEAVLYASLALVLREKFKVTETKP